MTKGYTDLKNLVEEYWPLVAYRYMIKKGFSNTFTKKELEEAFKSEGFESPYKLWERVIDECLGNHFESTQHEYDMSFLERINEEPTAPSTVDDEIPF